MPRLIPPPKTLISLIPALLLAGALGGCGSPAGAAPADPRIGSAQPTQPLPTAAPPMVTSSVVRLASASDLEHLTALVVADGFVYFTGGGTLLVPDDAPPGSDTFGVLRRVSVEGGAVEELWKGQGIGYAVARHTDGIAFATYDYASRGRTGTVRVLRPDRTVQNVGTWRSHGSCIGLAADAGTLFWTHSEGASGVLNRTDAAGTTSTTSPDGACPGKPHLRRQRLFWLAGPRLIQSPTSSLAARVLWDGRQPLAAMAAHDAAAEIVVVDHDELVAIDPETGRSRVVGSGYSGTTDLAFDSAGVRIFATNAEHETVTAIALADGSKVVIATAQRRPRAIVTAGDAVYWIEGDSPSVMATRF